MRSTITALVRGGDDDEPGAAPRLKASQLLACWIGLLAVAILTIGIFVAAVPLRYAQLSAQCSAQCGAIPAFLVALDCGTALVWVGLAALILWRRPADGVGLFAVATMLLFGVARFPNTPLALGASHPEWLPVVESLRFLGSSCLSVFVFVFPDGRFYPRITSIFAAGWIIVQIPEFFFPGSALSSNGWPASLRLAGFLAFVCVVVVAQAWRYQRASSAIQRRQTRWVVLGLSGALLCYLALEFVYPLVAEARIGLPVLAPVTVSSLTSLTFLLFPVTLGFAMLRYRLYDVDRIINRIVVYGATTAALAALYVALVLGLQAALFLTTGGMKSSSLVIVGSTLLSAALFQPLRRMLQRRVDTVFFRRRYDTEKTIHAFAASLRHEVDLADVRQRLLDITHDTLHPAHASLWLRPLTRAEPHDLS